jgi:asparagine synthetase B (glutamine-hydrolysing)
MPTGDTEAAWSLRHGTPAGGLDEAGLGEARIFASGGLDEYAIAGLVADAAPIDAYGVGTKMGVCADAPYRPQAAHRGPQRVHVHHHVTQLRHTARSA